MKYVDTEPDIDMPNHEPCCSLCGVEGDLVPGVIDEGTPLRSHYRAVTRCRARAACDQRAALRRVDTRKAQADSDDVLGSTDELEAPR